MTAARPAGSRGVGLGGFGYGRMQIDFSFHIVLAAPGAPTDPADTTRTPSGPA